MAAAGEGVPVPVQGGAPPLASTDFAQQQQGGEQPVQGRDWSTGASGSRNLAFDVAGGWESPVAKKVTLT